MLVQFSIKNFLSIADEITLDMRAAAISDHKDTHTFEARKDLQLLKSAVVYGANASGKSNLFKAFEFLRRWVVNSSKDSQASEKIPVSPFLLDESTENAPSFFELEFVHDQALYRYGIELDQTCIHAEWLFCKKNKRELELFTREKQTISVSKHFEEGKGLEKRVRENALLLSVCAQFNGEISTKLLKYIDEIQLISGLDDQAYMHRTLELLKDSVNREKVEKLLMLADIGICGIEHKEIHANIPKNIAEQMLLIIEEAGRIIPFQKAKKIDYSLLHKKKGEKGDFSKVPFNFEERESQGTQKLFALAGIFLHSLEQGKTLLIDEFEARLHPLITRALVGLFHDPSFNQKNAQLIFATHDTTLLVNTELRRDQIWFVEKNDRGASDLYSLVEIQEETGKKVRKDASFGKNYLLGKYGGIPAIGDLYEILQLKGSKDVD